MIYPNCNHGHNILNEYREGFIIINTFKIKKIMASSRRSFLRNAVTCTASAAVLPVFTREETTPKPRIKLSISSYSYWHFKEKKFPLEAVIDEAAKLGVEGIDILHRQMDSEDKVYKIGRAHV